MTLIRTMETPAGDKGYLQVQVVNIENNFPIQGARVSISVSYTHLGAERDDRPEGPGAPGGQPGARYPRDV